MNRVYVIERKGVPVTPVRAYAKEGTAKGATKTGGTGGRVVSYVPESEVVRLRIALERIAGYTMSMCPSADEMPRILKRMAREALGEVVDTGESGE